MPIDTRMTSAALSKFGTILVDPPWRFQNRTGKTAPEHARLSRYETMPLEKIMAFPVGKYAAEKSHLYLWVPNALLPDAFRVMEAWGFTYKTNLVWLKIREDGGPDRRCCGFYFRNCTENILFGIRGGLLTSPPVKNVPNVISTRKREHSRKPDELYSIIEESSPGPYLELFARNRRDGWQQMGDQLA